MMLVARLGEVNNDYEQYNQIGPRDTHGPSYAAPYVCTSKRKCDARRSASAISSNRWSLGDFRSALCEIEIGDVPKPTRPALVPEFGGKLIFERHLT